MLVSGSTHRAKVSTYGVTTTKAGDPLVFINFAIKEDDHVEIVKWTGTVVNDVSREITLRTLGICGMTADKLVLLVAGPDGGALNLNHEVEVKVKEETWNGKSSLKVDRVDPIGGFAEMMSQPDFKMVIGKFNLQGEFLSVAAKYGIKPVPTVENIPF